MCAEADDLRLPGVHGEWRSRQVGVRKTSALSLAAAAEDMAI